MKRLAFFFMVIMVFVSLACSDTGRIPSNVIPRDKMEDIMWDMLMADNYAAQYLAHDSSLDLKNEKFRLYAEVFQIHHVDKEKFITSYRFYLEHPDLTSALFDSLSHQANRRRTEMFKVTDVQ